MTGRGFGRALPNRAASGAGFGGAATHSTLSFSTPPPDLSQITNSNLVVSFRGLLKKSATTQAKALEDIRKYVTAQKNELEGSIIKAWSEMYPRLAINNSRKVRELSHSVQLAIFEVAKSGIEPHIPQMVPTWLAGTFDNDKGVAKAATLGWNALLNFNEKMSSLLKKSQPAILAYAQEGLEETPETLSDERTMSPEDLKATYNRLIGNCIDMVGHLMKSISEEDRKKYSSKYEAFLSNSDFLKCTSSEDVHLRRSSIQLISVFLFREPTVIKSNLKMVANAVLSDAVRSTQLGSAFALLDLIKVLTAHMPEIWSEISSKKNPLVRLRAFIEKGSQRGQAEYWSCLAGLLAIMPQSVLPAETKTILDILTSTRLGIRNRDEPKVNIPAAWSAYFNIVFDMITKRLSYIDSQLAIIQEAVLPAIQSFMLAASDDAAWSVDSAKMKQLFKFISSLESGPLRELVCDLVSQTLKSCAGRLEEDLTSSVPDDVIKSRFERWFGIVEWILTDSELKTSLDCSKPEHDNVLSATDKLIRACPKAIDERQGKSYGAAAGLSICMNNPIFVKERPSSVNFVKSYLDKNIFSLLATPSGEDLLTALKALKTLGQQEAFESIWFTTVAKILEMKPSEKQIVSIVLLLWKSDATELALKHEQLQRFISQQSKEALKDVSLEGKEFCWSILSAATSSQSMSDETAVKAIDLTVANLLSGEDIVIDRGLRALKCFTKDYLPLLLSPAERRRNLLTCLLLLNQEDNSDAPARQVAVASLTNVISEGGNEDPSVAMIDLLKYQVKTRRTPSLSIRTLVDLARNVTGDPEEETSKSTILSLFPSKEELDTLTASWNELPPSSFAGTEPFGNAQSLIHSESSLSINTTGAPIFDNQGCSILLRVARYICEIMTSTMSMLSPEKAAEIAVFLCTAQQLIYFQSISCTRDEAHDRFSGREILDRQLSMLLTEVVIRSDDWRRNGKQQSSDDDASILDIVLKIMLTNSNGTTPFAFYSSLALRKVLNTIVRIRSTNFECAETQLKEFDIFGKNLETPFKTLAVLHGFGSTLIRSDELKLHFKTLIGTIYGIKAGPLDDDGIQKVLLILRMLNGCLEVYGEEEIPTNTVQIVQAVKKLLSWIDPTDFSGQRISVAAEVCRALTKLLPAINYSSGSHWEEALTKLCLAPWALYSSTQTEAFRESYGSELLTLCTWSLRMYSRLARLQNLDDEEAFAVKDVFAEGDMQANLNQGLLGLLQACPNLYIQSDEIVFSTFHELLGPEISKIPVKEIDLSSIYPLVDSSVPATQAIAFETIERSLPKMIDDLTMQVALDGKEPELPPELLSLLLSESLPIDHLPSSSSSNPNEEQNLQSHISALLTWKLVIRCFALAPHQVKIGFSKSLQELDVLKRLMGYIYLTWGTRDGKLKPLSMYGVDKVAIREYDIESLSNSEGIEKNIPHLTANIYFLALSHLPQLVQSWYRDFTRAGKVSLQSWTEKNFSPLVLEDTISSIRTWRGESETKTMDGENNFIIKLPAKSGNSILLSYEIDDQYCSISFSIPSSYPLDSITVQSIQRVAVPERTWVSTLTAISGAMRFNFGSVVDGIEVFYKNVSGYLEGHENCYICYSVVSEDMKVPDKTCGTCRKVYHGKCLSQWFASSNGNTCPTCRQPFLGMGRGIRPVGPRE